MCIDILRRLMVAVRRNHPEKWWTNILYLLHDNAPAHRSVLFKDFLTKNSVTTLEHPLAAADFLPLPSTKISIERSALLWCHWQLRMRWKSWKVFHRWLPGMNTAPLQLLAEAYSCVSGLFWSKYSLKLLFFFIFPGTCCSYHVYDGLEYC